LLHVLFVLKVEGNFEKEKVSPKDIQNMLFSLYIV